MPDLCVGFPRLQSQTNYNHHWISLILTVYGVCRDSLYSRDLRPAVRLKMTGPNARPTVHGQLIAFAQVLNN